MKTVIMKTLDDLDVVARVARAHFDKHGETMVVVKNLDESITDAQRAFHFVLCGIIGADLGNTKDGQHQYFKERFLLNIYINDTENHPEFIGVVDNMMTVKKHCPEQYSAIRKLVVGGVSIKDATKANMMELLTEEIGFASDHQIRIPLPPREGLVSNYGR